MFGLAPSRTIPIPKLPSSNGLWLLPLIPDCLCLGFSFHRVRTYMLGSVEQPAWKMLSQTYAKHEWNILCNHIVVGLTLQIEVVSLEGWAREESSVCERSAIIWRDKIIKMSEPPLAGSPACTRGWTPGYLWPSGPPLQHLP